MLALNTFAAMMAIPLLTLLSLPAWESKKTSQDLGQRVQEQITPCPAVQVMLDGTAQRTGSSVVIAIARLGNGESSRRLNLRRLYNIRAYLTKYGNTAKLRNEELILAEGERVQGLGRIELYVEGELKYTLFAGRGRDLHVAECESPNHKRYYPGRTRTRNEPVP